MLIFLAIMAIVGGIMWFLNARKGAHFMMSIAMVFGGFSYLVL